MVAQHLDLDERPPQRRLNVLVGEDGPAVAVGPGILHQPVEPRAQCHLARQGGRAALVGDGVHRDLPPLAGRAEQTLVGDEDVVEEDLTELCVASDLHHRAHLDSGRLQVDDQEGDALVRRDAGIGAGEHAAKARELRPRDPRLLPADEVAAVGLDRRRAEGGKIGPRLRLGEALAPDLLRREDRSHMPPPLGIGAECEQGGTEDVEPDDRDELGRSRRSQLLIDDDLLRGRPAAAPELGRPGAADEAGRVELGLPPPQILDPGGELVGSSSGSGQLAARNERTRSCTRCSSAESSSLIAWRRSIPPPSPGQAATVGHDWLAGR